ncbi:MAG: cation:dicarboxylase symporter family transporter [Spirochaetaceae bacterium]|nr:cation:dicarboxylase symporter family transporter [Spirochaetaceae bacterium]
MEWVSMFAVDFLILIPVFYYWSTDKQKGLYTLVSYYFCMLLTRLSNLPRACIVRGFAMLELYLRETQFALLRAILSIAGIPFSLTTLVIGVESILDRFRTLTNTQGDIAAGIIVAKSEKTLAGTLYNAY